MEEICLWNTCAPILSAEELEGLKSDGNTKWCKYAVCEGVEGHG